MAGGGSAWGSQEADADAMDSARRLLAKLLVPKQVGAKRQWKLWRLWKVDGSGCGKWFWKFLFRDDTHKICGCVSRDLVMTGGGCGSGDLTSNMMWLTDMG